MNDQKVLVTGANGFVGSHLVEALLARGYAVRCMVRDTSDLEFVRDLPVEWTHADLAVPATLRRACEGAAAVLHLAALTRALDEEAFMRVNARGVESLARACLEVNPGVRRFVFLSSHAAVGPSGGPGDYVDELSVPRPVDWYGKSKLEAEQLLRNLGDRLRLTVIRASAVFGPRDRDFLAYFRLVKRGVSLQLGRQERKISLIYVRDLVRLLIMALEDESALGQTYLGCGNVCSYVEFGDAIARALDRRVRRIILPEAVLGPLAVWSNLRSWITGTPGLLYSQRLIDMRQPYWLCTARKAQRELGFVPIYELDDALLETANWYQVNGWL